MSVLIVLGTLAAVITVVGGILYYFNRTAPAVVTGRPPYRS